MEVKTYIRKQIKSMHNLQDSVLKGLTQDQLDHVPPGTAHPIGVIWLHMVSGEDGFISIVLEEPKLWERNGWDIKFGLEKPPNVGEDWQEYQGKLPPIELLQAYTQEVREQTAVCLESLTEETLDEKVKFFSDSDPKANPLVIMIGHTLIHSGEIAALKGIQGERGLPF